MNDCDDMKDSLELASYSLKDTEQLGERLGVLLQSGDLLCLSGSLGAGKTSLTRGLARAWGALEPPTSPTFTLINEYHRSRDDQRFYHADCYRLQNAADAVTTGLEDLFDLPGVLVIEWSERISGLLPQDRLEIQIQDLGNESRSFTLTACGERAMALLQALRAALR
jgi:tRNA threonylcarbamoyladenosine biosynthesis protein TsaE